MYVLSAKTSYQKKILGKLSILITGFALFMLLTFLPTANSRAAGQDGAIDFTFKNGTVPNGDVLAMVQQNDGKIILVGQFTDYDTTPRNRIARLNPDGSLDNSFNPGSGADGTIYAIGLQNDGKILIGGIFTSYNGSPRNNLARLNSDGSLDNSFLDVGNGANSTVLEIKQLQNDGKIILGGDFTSYNGTAINRIARLNTDGSLDTSFNPGAGLDREVDSIAIQADSKILIAGFFYTFNGLSRNRIARLNADGSLDTSFNPGVGTGNNATTYGLVVNLQSDGKILFGGIFDSYNNTSCKNAVRLNSNGSLDTCFNIGSTGSSVRAIEQQNDGKILIGGDVIIRLNTDGAQDTSFTAAISNKAVTSIILQSDNKIVLGSMLYASGFSWGNRIVRLNPDGSLDNSFNPLRGADNTILALTLQNDNKIIASGDFITYTGVSRKHIARLNPDGELDTSFNPGEGANAYIWTTQLQNDGKILIGGDFTSYNGTSINRIARLNPDGTLDTSFNPGSGSTGNIRTMRVQNDGKILIGGFFANYNNTFVKGFARLNPDGSLDTSFNSSGSGFSSGIVEMALQNDGKIVVIGNFTSYNGVSRLQAARLNPDGSLDLSFDPGSNIDPSLALTAMALQNDGKVIIAGGKFIPSSTMQKKIIRLNPDGSLDTSFNPGTDIPASGGWGYIYNIVQQNDGRLILVGDFSLYNGVAYKGIVRLNTDGSLDTSFNVGATTRAENSSIHAAKLQNDGKLLLGGNYFSVNNYFIRSLARLELVNKEPSSVTLTSSPNPATFGQAVTFTSTVTPQAATGTVTFTFGSNVAVAVPLVNGLATYMTNTLAAGATEVRATYSGDTTYLLSGSPLYTQTVTKLASSVEVSSSPNPSQYGQSVTFSATVTPQSATGTVTFTIGGTNVPRPVTNGVATYVTYLLLPAGSYPVTATYSGSAIYSSSVSSGQYIHEIPMIDTSINLISSPNPAALGQNVTFTATVTPLIASGIVTFTFNGTTSLTATLRGSVATYVTNTLPVGTHLVTASFAGNSNYNPSSTANPLQQIIEKASSNVSLTSSANPAYAGSNVTFTATVTPLTASGTVTFTFTKDGISQSAVGNITNGLASYLTNTLPVGATAVQAIYSGDATSLPATSSIYTQTVTKLVSSVAVSSSPNPSQYGQSVTFTATLTPQAATGTVTFTIGGTNVPRSVSNGVATYVTDTLAVGSYPVTATYSGSAVYSSSVSVGQYNHEVSKANSSINLVSSSNPSQYGQSVTFTASVTPQAATGTVTFTFGSNVVVTAPVVNGLATYMTNTLAAGATEVRATYSGDTTYVLSGSPLYTQTVTKLASSVAVISSPNPSQYGQSVTFSATVTPQSATGTVTFTIGGVNIPRSVSNGVATYVTDTLAVGSYAVTASYGGSAVYSSSVSAGQYSHEVSKANSSISLISSPNPAALGQNVTFTATVTPLTATGTVTFTFDNLTTVTGTLINGVASYATNTLAVGIHEVKAAYGGDANHSGSLSEVYTQAIVANCNPALVTRNVDDGASSCGTFSHALAHTDSGTITFDLGANNMIIFNQPLDFNLKPGVAIDGGAAGIILNGNGQFGDGLRLGGNNRLTSLTIKGFVGRELVAVPGGSASILYRVKLES